MRKETSIEFLLTYTKDLPDYIKEYVISKHNIEIRHAFIDGTLNGMKSHRGEQLMEPDDYYNQIYKGGQNE